MLSISQKSVLVTSIKLRSLCVFSSWLRIPTCLALLVKRRLKSLYTRVYKILPFYGVCGQPTTKALPSAMEDEVQAEQKLGQRPPAS